MSGYESEQLRDEYLLFHYGSAEEVLPWAFGPREALGYPARCAAELAAAVSSGGRALDLGCAVGRSTFELARVFTSVKGIDFSRSFIATANKLQQTGELAYECMEEGDRRVPLVAHVPAEVQRGRVSFEVGDAMQLRADLGRFDAVLAANLIDRLGEPRRFLARCADLIRLGGCLLISSPYTWLEEFTPRAHWLGGGNGEETLDALQCELEPDFELQTTRDLPFLIREHRRKFQWSVAQASIWRRRGRSGN